MQMNKATDSIGETLQKIDWSFSHREKAPSIESIHPYPAKFIGEIPSALISELSIPAGTTVFDPFCGSGTTLVEAQKAGLNSVGIDLNPIACLISRVKTQPLSDGFSDAVSSIIDQANKVSSFPDVDIPNIDHWFKPDIQHAVSALSMVMAESTYAPWFDQLRLALSSILVRVSNQESDTRYAAIEKNVDKQDVFRNFKLAATKLEKSLMDRDWPLLSAKVIEGNTLEVSGQEVGTNIGMVITSPPYPNAYEYWLYHKYRMWWLGFDPLKVKRNEIGARAHFFKKNHHTEDHFVDQMRETFKLINSVLVDSGMACFVVGRSKIHGKVINNGDIIEQAATEVGLNLVTRFDRVINAKRKSFNLSHAAIKTEAVLVFKKS